MTSDAARKRMYIVVTNNRFFFVPNLLQEFLDAVEVVVGYSVSLEIHDHFLDEKQNTARLQTTLLFID